MDSDLREAIIALKAAFEEQGSSPPFGQAQPELVAALKARLQLPRRYHAFLSDCDPRGAFVATPVERLQLFGSAELEAEQKGFALDERGQLLSGRGKGGWRPSWIVVGQSTLLGDPYFLDVAKLDAEGDCPVLTAMSGTDTWQPQLCASGFAAFLRILAASMELARGFDLDDFDPDNERVFREALGPRVRQIDPAAYKAGHWS